MQILGSSPTYLYSAISSGMDSVAQGIVQTAKQDGMSFLGTAIDTFSFAQPGAQELLDTNAAVSAPAEYLDPVSFLGNQDNSSEMFVALKEQSFRSGEELNHFSTNLLHLVANLQPDTSPEQKATLNDMAIVVGEMDKMNQNLDLNVRLANLSGPGTFNLGKLPLPSNNILIPAEPIVDSSNLKARPFRIFARDGNDQSDIDFNDLNGKHYGSSNRNFMNMVGAVAKQNPNRIRNMITENSDGSYTVTFKEKISNNPITYRNRPVIVDSYTVTKQFAGTKKELWPFLIENAWGRSNSDPTQKPLDKMEAITGRPVTEREIGVDLTFDQMKKDFDSGKAMCVVSIERDLKYGTSESKNIAVTRVYTDDAGNKMIELRSVNSSPFSIPFDDLDKVRTQPNSYLAVNYSTLVTS